ncbi:MAG: HEPN domain-containing protein [Candidatus Brocadiales bacterium]
MDEGLKEQAGAWFERGAHDIETAQLLHDRQGYTDIIAFHIHQAVEKYLKGYLVFNDKKPHDTHELKLLIKEAAKLDQGLSEYVEFCDRVTRYYVQECYPTGPLIEYSYQELAKDLEEAWNLTNRIKEILSGS